MSFQDINNIYKIYKEGYYSSEDPWRSAERLGEPEQTSPEISPEESSSGFTIPGFNTIQEGDAFAMLAGPKDEEGRYDLVIYNKETGSEMYSAHSVFPGSFAERDAYSKFESYEIGD